jgi:hypothetical protein
LQPVRWLTPKERNKSSLIGVVLQCEECQKPWAALHGGWRIRPDGIYCDQCSEAAE